MKELIEKLKAATGPDRKLDAEIAKLVGTEYGPREDVHIESRSYSVWDEVAPYYTESLDAAHPLVPDDLYWIMAKGRTRPDEPLYGIQILDPETNAVIHEAEHDSLPVCICIAVLSARSA